MIRLGKIPKVIITVIILVQILGLGQGSHASSDAIDGVLKAMDDYLELLDETLGIFREQEEAAQNDMTAQQVEEAKALIDIRTK